MCVYTHKHVSITIFNEKHGCEFQRTRRNLLEGLEEGGGRGKGMIPLYYYLTEK